MLWRMDLTIVKPECFLPGDGFDCGSYTQIGDNVKVGANVVIGRFCIIADDCEIGDNVVIGDYVRLGPKTILKDKVFMDSYTLTSGQCSVGERSQIRYQSIIARNVVVGKDVFFCAGVKTAYLDHMGNPTPDPMQIRDRVFVGDNSTILAGLDVAYGSIIGAHTLVTKHIKDPNGIWIGTPAKYMRDMKLNEILRRRRRIKKI